jgi:hypothetical protein
LQFVRHLGRAMMVLRALGLLLAVASHPVTAITLTVDCGSGSDDAAGTAAAPLRTLEQAHRLLRGARGSSEKVAPASVHIKGLCELAQPLELGAADSHVAYLGIGDGAILSAGTQLHSSAGGLEKSHLVPRTVDLMPYNFSSSTLGQLRGRGYTGGSACILLNNLEASQAELFFRPGSAASLAGARSSGAEEVGTMRLARFPNIAGAVPSTSDWAKITSVQNHTLKIGGVTPTKLAAWAAEIKAGRQVFAHGLWDWNWADSHRPLSSIDAAAGTVTVGDDDINRDVNPIKTGHGSAQGKDTTTYVYFWLRFLVQLCIE